MSSNKKKRSKNKKKKASVGGMRAQIAAAKKELADAQQTMREAQEAKNKLDQQIQTLKEQTELAEQQKNAASLNLDSINSDLTDSLDSTSKDIPKTTKNDTNATKKTSSSIPSYGDKEYWNERYSEASHSESAQLHVDEWYVDSLEQLETFLSPIVYDKTEQRVLDLGCGTSTLGDQMSQAGYEYVYCVDYSEAVINTCKQRNTNVQYATMDARSLEYEANFFRCVIDKGTMDAILSGGATGGENAANDAVQSATEMLKEVHRVLELGGAYVLISSMPPKIYIPTIQGMTNGFTITHKEENASWSNDLSLQVYTLTKKVISESTASIASTAPTAPTAPSMPSGLPFSQEQMQQVMEYAKAAQAEQKAEQLSRDWAARHGGTISTTANTDVDTTACIATLKTKRIKTSILRRDPKNIWLKWCIGDDLDTTLIGGSERDYVILCRHDVPMNNVHVYEGMEWLEIEEEEEEEEGEFGMTPTKSRVSEEVGKKRKKKKKKVSEDDDEEEEEEEEDMGEYGMTPIRGRGDDEEEDDDEEEEDDEEQDEEFQMNGVLRFAMPKKVGLYEFRYVAESIAWKIKVDTVVYVSESFTVGNVKEETKKETSSKTDAVTSVTSQPPSKNRYGVTPTPVTPKPAPYVNSPWSIAPIKPQTMDALTEAGPSLPPNMMAATKKKSNSSIPLTYLLEKRNNISCYQLFIHRPIHVVGDVSNDAKLPPVPSPPHVRLHLDLQHQPSLICRRNFLSLTFYNNENGAIEYSVSIPFNNCQIDPKKSTFAALPGHWSFRLPFYFGGSETDVGRDHPRHRLPRSGELTVDAMSTVRCGFCEEDMFDVKGMRRVTRAPSPYWSELSDYWFCLKEQASTRLEELSAHGGDYPIAHNDVVNDRVSLLAILESDGLGLQDRVTTLPLTSGTKGVIKSGILERGPIGAPGCNGTTYEVLHINSQTNTENDGEAVHQIVQRNSIVRVHARGTISKTGTTFWDTRSTNGGQTFQYEAGIGAVIRGWDQGCMGMSVGERRRVVIPSNEGYGSAGFPSWGIPSNTSITFDLECISIDAEKKNSNASSTMRDDLEKALRATTTATTATATTTTTANNLISMASSTSAQQAERSKKVIEISNIAEELCSVQFNLSEISVSVMELKCTEEGCPPLETAFAVMEKDIDCKFKVFKELIQVTRTDIQEALQAWVRGDTPICFTFPEKIQKEVAILSCKRCLTTIGTSQLRDDGSNVVRMWKCHLTMAAIDGKVENNETTFENYTVDSIVGHAVLDGMEQRGVTRYVVQTFTIDDEDDKGDMRATTNEERIEMIMTVLNAHEFASSHEYSEMQPVIRVLYETETSQSFRIKRSPELWQRNASEWIKKHGAERIILSAEDAESMAENLQGTTDLLPESSRQLNGMAVGFLRW